MPARRTLTMRQLRRIMRMHYEGASAREIARSVRMARSTVQDELKRAAAAKLSWPLADELTDELLEARLFARSGGRVGAGVRKRQCSGPQDHQDPWALSQRRRGQQADLAGCRAISRLTGADRSATGRRR